MLQFFSSYVDYINPATVVGALVYALIFLILIILVSWLVHLVVKRVMKRASNATGFGFVDQLLRVIIILFMLTLYAQLVPPLRALGTTILASVSVASIVIGLAAQSTLSNLIAGFSLLLYRPFREGDWVQLSTPRGLTLAKIETLMLGHTLLRDEEDNEIIVPNSVMAGSVLIRVHKK